MLNGQVINTLRRKKHKVAKGTKALKLQLYALGACRSALRYHPPFQTSTCAKFREPPRTDKETLSFVSVEGFFLIQSSACCVFTILFYTNKLDQ